MKVTTAFILVELEGDDKLRQVALSKQQQQLLIQLLPTIADSGDGVVQILDGHMETISIGRGN